MKTDVIVGEQKPPTTIKLELDVAEFAAIYRCVFCGLDGYGPVRQRVQRGLDGALANLPDEWRSLVHRVKARDGLTVVDAIKVAFGE